MIPNTVDLMVWYVLSAVNPYIYRLVPLQIMSNQLNLLHVDSKWEAPEPKYQES